MKQLKNFFAILFFVATIFGTMGVAVEAFTQPIILVPIGVAALGFISYFLAQETK